MSRYEVRSASTTGEVAIIDRVAERVEVELGNGENALEKAFALCDEFNALEQHFQESEHTIEAFSNQWKNTVN